MKRAVCVLLLVLLGAELSAAEHYGQVTIAGVPIPGATITATQGDRRVETVTDQQGVYHFEELANGVWTINVEMQGFSSVTREVTVGPDASPVTWELTLMPFDTILSLAKTNPNLTPAATAAPQVTQVPAQQLTAAAPTPTPAPGFQRAGVTPTTRAPLPPAPADEPSGDAAGAADGFLINGSVNNGAATPFAQLRAFGNNRPGQRSLYNGGIGILAGNSVWDARPYAFGGQQAAKPSYNDVHLLGSFGGPLKIPGLLTNRPVMVVGYQHTSDHNATAQSALMPTLQERTGDLSQSSVKVIDPRTGQPFPGNLIPSDRISPQAAALLGYYPQPNLDAGGRYNFQTSLVTALQQDNVQTRVTQPVNTRNQLFGTFAYQRTATDSTTLFGFQDSTVSSGIDTAVNWSHRFGPLFSLRLRYQFTRLTNRTTPYFADRQNVSGDAGIVGNDQDPVNWGPPTLTFSDGLAGLYDARYDSTRNTMNGGSVEIFWSRRGRHNFTYGGGVRRNHVDILSQLDPRGSFAFTGAATGSELADFLLGVPSTISIASGNPDKYLRASSYDAYLSDDWRVSPSLTVNAGIRWEYEAPLTERFGRLANLDVASGFAAVAPVTADDPIGTLTGQDYPDSLLHPDKTGVQPRIGLSWRPIAGSSVVIRGGYGIYRNTAVYQSIMTILAQQPPLSNTFSVANSQAHPVTLANGFLGVPGTSSSTFAVDPDFRVGSAHNWQVSLQRDLPQSLTIIATYLGTKGSHLPQEFLPNTYPLGGDNPCLACPIGFVYLTSNGSSSKHAGQLQLRRRLRNGLTATVQYTLSKADDDAAAFAGAAVAGASIAQNWRDLDAERGPSNFDQRHLLTAQFEYTTGVGVTGGALLDGIKGALWKGWTVTSQLTTGSGLPLTPVYLTFVPGTGVTGTIRAAATGESTDAPTGFFVNPSAFAAPASGQWGTAGRNSVRGPAQFQLNAGISRTFPKGRLNFDWRIDATNLLNRVIYSSVNTIVGSPQFGLADRANPMRKLQTSLRVRF